MNGLLSSASIVGMDDEVMNHNAINAMLLYFRMASFLAVKLSCGHICWWIKDIGMKDELPDRWEIFCAVTCSAGKVHINDPICSS